MYELEDLFDTLTTHLNKGEKPRWNASVSRVDETYITADLPTTTKPKENKLNDKVIFI